jgi:glycosyltransferase involved in cell wall biosynthesis
VLAAYAGRWPRLRVIRSAQRGAAHARNLGLAACRSPFVAFLDSDDVWMPDKLRRQMALFAARPQVGIVHCACMVIDEQGARRHDEWVDPPTKRGHIFEQLLNASYNLSGSASAVVTRRDLVEKVGGFDENLLHVEDQDMWLRLARVAEVDFVPDELVGLRRHRGNRFDQRARSDPALALLQKVAVWSKWRDHIDEQAIAPAFRRRALTVNRAPLFRLIFHFRFYRKLKQSELPLARRLFPDFPSYLRYFFRARMGPRMSPRLTWRRVKRALATKLILRYPPLLRLAQMLGKFRGVDPLPGR